uniref:Toll-like receptor 22 n=1 Tax=Kryptolebias marmoratus TaxID=37003 RepID=A0A3Q3BS30_KRYMA
NAFSNYSQLQNFLLFFLLLLFNSSLAYSLKNCTEIYQENPSAGVALNCAYRRFKTIPDDIPKNAVSIQLNGNWLQKLNKDDFHGMSNLVFLDVKSNCISYVENGSFADLVLLKTLYMRSNCLSNLTGFMFQGLSSLTVLDLNSNKIQVIHNAAFQFLTSLQVLDLSENQLQQASDIQPILQLLQIQRLDLTCNLFFSFETKDLQLNFSSSLKELVISSDYLKKFSITTPVFPYLQKLDLSSCAQSLKVKWDIPDKNLLRNITQLYLAGTMFSVKREQTLLQNFDSLRHLSLQYWNRFIEKGLLSTVCQISTLRSLDLNSNYLKNWPVQRLASCSDLTDLDLSRNEIAELPKTSIQSLNKLRSLNMCQNKLTKVPYDVRILTSLEILNMNANLISELSCEDFVNTTHLMELSLNKNRITKLDKCVFEHLSDLKLLDLSNNLLQTVGDTFKGSLQKLDMLDLSHNAILILSAGEFQGLQSLRHMNVASNNFPLMEPKTFSKLNNLEDLVASLSFDFVTYFRGLQHLENLTIYLCRTGPLKIPVPKDTEAFFQLKSLKNLTVICSSKRSLIPLEVPKELLRAMKHLESFKAENIYNKPPDWDTFQFNTQLKSLTLTKTDLSNLKPNLFLPIPNLQVLDLSESNLKSIDFLVQANLTALRYLKLTDNEMVGINETVLRSLPSLIYLNLDNNPFNCECSNADFIQWIKNNKQTQVVNAHQYKCSFPLDRRGTFLLDFDVQSCWNDGSFFYFISSTCLVVLTLLTSFIYHFLRWQLAYTFHLFLAFVYDSRRRKKGDPHQFDAFVSYNVHDEDWVYREMLPVLEGEQGWRLCLHHRDFQPGKPIMENITDAIYGSRKTICVISRHYLQSEWCSREIQMASFRLFDEQKDVLILLFLEDIPSRHLSPYYRMRKLVKKRTYLSWPQAAQHPGVFWQNVQRALQTGDALTEETDLLTGPAGP